MKAVSETLKKRLKRFFGGRFSFDTLSRVCASFDASRVGPVLPIGVLRPESADDVVKLVRFCNREKVGVVARGAASGMTGGAVPTENSVVIDFSSMNRILEINPSNRSATVEPGVLVGDLQRAVAKYKLFYPPDPASADFCTIGG
ncbi:MAG: FAD-binding oxidoreductase, partial [Planctomycetota bacterium]|nr:FAD-binding oxidoreductase [Planctomycetota bacterium]